MLLCLVYLYAVRVRYFPEPYTLQRMLGSRHLSGYQEVYAAWQRVQAMAIESRPLYPTWLEMVLTVCPHPLAGQSSHPTHVLLLPYTGHGTLGRGKGLPGRGLGRRRSLV
jgi:hypothetical protein